MNQIKVSVCISVYNSERYLSRCLDSVVRQTLKNIEIVLINDGSTDTSLDIMNNYKEKYIEREISIISQNNLGLAIGRQTAIENSIGEYIVFLDADDYVEETAYEKMLNFAEKNQVEIVEARTIRGDKIWGSPYTGIMDADKYLKKYFWGKPYIQPMLWLRMYKRELFKRRVFPDLYANNEDIFAFPCILFQSNQIGFLSDVLHHYSMDNNASIMLGLPQKKEQSKEYYENRKTTLEAINYVQSFLGNSIYDKYQDEFLQYKQRIIAEFLYKDVYNISLNNKVQYVMSKFNFKSKKEVFTFIRKNTRNNTMYSITLRLFGVLIANYIRKMKENVLCNK